MDRRGKRGARNRGSSRKAAVMDYSDEDGSSSEEESSILATKKSKTKRPTASSHRQERQYQQEESSEEESNSDDDGGSEEDSDEDDHHHNSRGRSLGGLHDPMNSHRYAGGGGSYLPTAYGGGPPGVDAALGGQAKRERSVDRIRARSRDRRRDISRERSARRDRSRSISQSRKKSENQKANERAAERRRNRRISLEQSLGMMSVGGGASDDVSLAGESVQSTATEGSSFSLINGMDTSVSSRNHASSDYNRRTSTDYASERRSRRGTSSGGKPNPTSSKSHDGRLDEVLNRRRGARTSGSPAENVSAGKGSGRKVRATKSFG